MQFNEKKPSPINSFAGSVPVGVTLHASAAHGVAMVFEMKLVDGSRSELAFSQKRGHFADMLPLATTIRSLFNMPEPTGFAGVFESALRHLPPCFGTESAHVSIGIGAEVALDDMPRLFFVGASEKKSDTKEEKFAAIACGLTFEVAERLAEHVCLVLGGDPAEARIAGAAELARVMAKLDQTSGPTRCTHCGGPNDHGDDCVRANRFYEQKGG